MSETATATATKAPTTIVPRLYSLGSVLLLFVGIGHTAGHLSTMVHTPSPAESVVQVGMATLRPMEGSPHSLLDFHEGNSLGMGLMFLAFGALGLAVASTLRKAGLAFPTGLLAVPTLASLASLLLCLRYFPVPPIAFVAAASVSFAAAWAFAAGARTA